MAPLRRRARRHGGDSPSRSARARPSYGDYNRFYRHQQQGHTQWHQGVGRPDASEPLKVAYLFAERRSGHAASSIAFAPSKDVETAKQLLRRVLHRQLWRRTVYASPRHRLAVNTPEEFLGASRSRSSWTSRAKTCSACRALRATDRCSDISRLPTFVLNRCTLFLDGVALRYHLPFA
jgi:hypothetical protein